MKFEVHYPSGSKHEVELSGTVAIVGRDPSCDLVLNDARCSRRHAVLEAGPQGIAVRDTGSANGVFVNDKKVERAGLKEGDVVRLGEVLLKVLPEEVGGTLVMGPEDLADLSARAAPPAQASPAPKAAPPPPAAPAPAVTAPTPPAAVPSPPPPSPPRPAPPRAAPAAPNPAPLPQTRLPPRPLRKPIAPADASSAPVERPLTVTILAVLWWFSALVYAAGGVVAASTAPGGLGAILYAGSGLFLALIGGILGYGLWSLRSWGRILQIVVAVLGILACVSSLPSIAVLVYLVRPEVRLAFAGRRPTAAEAQQIREGSAEALFTGLILGTLMLGLLLGGIAAAIVLPSLARARAAAGEVAAIADLRVMAASQDAFRTGTCGAYADLAGLVSPSDVIPNYRPDGPPFVPPTFREEVRHGYRFELTTDGLVPPAASCPTRSFRGYVYSAAPVTGRGRHLALGTDGVIHAAADRPATLEDPALP